MVTAKLRFPLHLAELRLAKHVRNFTFYSKEPQRKMVRLRARTSMLMIE